MHASSVAYSGTLYAALPYSTECGTLNARGCSSLNQEGHSYTSLKGPVRMVEYHTVLLALEYHTVPYKTKQYHVQYLLVLYGS